MDDEFYNRQILHLGKENHDKIRSKTVMVVGLGGLGSPIILYLSRMGVKKLILVDPDVVEKSNLSRQVMYDLNDLGKKKVDVCVEKLSDFGKLEGYTNFNDASLDNVDLVVGCVDNWKTRFEISDRCLKNNVDYIDIAVENAAGHISYSNKEHCLRCVFTKKDEAYVKPISNTTCIFASSIALNVILRYMIGDFEYMKNKMIYLDAYNQKINFFNIPQNKSCFCKNEN